LVNGEFTREVEERKILGKIYQKLWESSIEKFLLNMNVKLRGFHSSSPSKLSQSGVVCNFGSSS
jgi:hypothetical protein